MKRIFKCFSLLLVSAFMMAIFSASKVSANYDNSKNYITINVGNYKDDDGQTLLSFQVVAKYQRGFSTNAQYMVCKKSDSKTILAPADCVDEDIEVGWTSFVTGNASDYISKEAASKADANPTTKSFEVKTGVLIDYYNKQNSYIIFVEAYFCAVREGTSDSGFGSCQYWHNSKEDQPTDTTIDQFTKREIKLGDALSTNYDEIEDEGLKTVMQKIGEIVSGTVMPIIYAVLGLFLVVKGAILGVQIVKSADEPQVRQEKIGSLKWLVIGVAVAFLAAGVVHVVMNFFEGQFSFR